MKHSACEVALNVLYGDGLEVRLLLHFGGGKKWQRKCDGINMSSRTL